MDTTVAHGTSSAKLTLEYVPIADLQMVWPQVKPGLKEVIRRAPAHWIPEDVYHALRANIASLHIATDPRDGEYLGFVVLMRVDAWDGPTLHIWAAHNTGARDVLVEAVGEIVGMARNINARRVTFSSQRRGWERTAALLGFRPATQNFEMEI